MYFLEGVDFGSAIMLPFRSVFGIRVFVKLFTVFLFRVFVIRPMNLLILLVICPTLRIGIPVDLVPLILHSRMMSSSLESKLDTL